MEKKVRNLLVLLSLILVAFVLYSTVFSPSENSTELQNTWKYSGVALDYPNAQFDELVEYDSASLTNASEKLSLLAQTSVSKKTQLAASYYFSIFSIALDYKELQELNAGVENKELCDSLEDYSLFASKYSLLLSSADITNKKAINFREQYSDYADEVKINEIEFFSSEWEQMVNLHSNTLDSAKLMCEGTV